MTIIEKAAYLKGLADGLKLDKESTEGKLIDAIIDIVGDLAKAQDETDDDLEYLSDYIDELDEDLGSVEEELYGSDACDGDCDCCDGDCDCECEDDDDFEITCPSCGETIVFSDLSGDDEDLICPNCKEKIVYDNDKNENK